MPNEYQTAVLITVPAGHVLDKMDGNTPMFRRVATASQAIRQAMAERGLMGKDIAKVLGSASKASVLMNGKRAPSKREVVRLHDLLGIPYDVLLQPHRPEADSE